MSNRSFWINQPVVILTFFIIAIAVIKSEEEVLEEAITERAARVEKIRSPMLEVLMHLPKNFRDVDSFKSFLGIEPGSGSSGNGSEDVGPYEISQPEMLGSKSVNPSNGKSWNFKRTKREDETVAVEKPEPQHLVSSLTEAGYGERYGNSAIPDGIEDPTQTTHTLKEFDVDHPDYPKRRRDDSVDDRDDNSQRDKRTFSDVANSGGGNGQSTTPLPFWKRKKENPPFITARGSAPKGNEYSPPQHRSSDSGRESHSLKAHENPGRGNEMGRSNQDSYYSATNRRAYSRLSDAFFSSTPKSVYDMMDDRQNVGKQERMGIIGRERHGRHPDGKVILDDGRIGVEEYAVGRHFPNDRRGRLRYGPPLPPAEIIGRGTEYYRRTFEPISGRIIYYADVPEMGRSFDYRNSINRDHGPNGFGQGRNFVPFHQDGRFSPGMGRPVNYARGGRSDFQAFPQSDRDADSYQRDPRFVGGYDRDNKFPGDARNKTYIIYDADDVRFHTGKNRFSHDTANRFGYPWIYNSYNQRPQEPFRRFPVFPTGDYFPQPAFPFGNRFRPIGPYWDFDQRGPEPEGRWLKNGNPPPKSFGSPEVQLPISTSNRYFDSSRDFDKNKKA